MSGGLEMLAYQFNKGKTNPVLFILQSQLKAVQFEFYMQCMEQYQSTKQIMFEKKIRWISKIYTTPWAEK